MNERIICSKNLKNGLKVDFCEHGNRYFGDYHQVKVTVRCRIDLTTELVSPRVSVDDLEKARKFFGASIEYRKLLRQMGVAGADVEKVQSELIENFAKNALQYMESNDFAARFVARQLANRKERSRVLVNLHD
ncbi:MAG: hypothetical protein C0623_12220 [Desulfuromonas sp.]|nr:MAG: hypothetical protein C0623_12220 [Desulfuromonas sp.]